MPRSRTNPQYHGDALQISLSEFQIAYEHIAALGGLRGRQRDLPETVNAFWQNQSFHNYADYALSETFRLGLNRLRELGHASPCAIMCAEAVWWRCHRRIISDYLIANGETVFHILGHNHIEPAHIRKLHGPDRPGPSSILRIFSAEINMHLHVRFELSAQTARSTIGQSWQKPFADLASRYRLDDPRDEATTLGPMAAARFAERSHTAEAIAKGARPLVDNARFPADRRGTAYLAPQVLVGVDHTMRVMTEESFGPVVGIMKVNSNESALRLMNDSPYGLTASIWTEDAEAAELIGDCVATGTVFMNRCDYIDPGLAWTGVKDTGHGAGMGPFGFEAVTRPKSFHLRLEH